MTTKRFMRFQVILLILLAISLVGNTFSWATRPAVKGGGFMGTRENDFIAAKLDTPDYYLNGNSCTAVTYKGTLNEATGEITYSGNPVTSFTDSARPGKEGDGLMPNEVHYFKTVITNTSDVPTTVSLYINGQYYNNTPVLYGVSSPVTTREGFITTIDNQKNKFFEFAPIVTHFEVNSASENGDGTSNIEWYIFYNNKDTAVVDMSEIIISDIILTNN